MWPSSLFFISSLSAIAYAQIPVVSLSEGAGCACSQLATEYGTSVLYSDSTNYTVEAIDYWDVRADLLPACIFLPTEADQVASAVSIIGSCGAQFAIRGGGHMNVRDSAAAGQYNTAQLF
jgi:hypothetical protein